MAVIRRSQTQKANLAGLWYSVMGRYTQIRKQTKSSSLLGIGEQKRTKGDFREYFWLTGICFKMHIYDFYINKNNRKQKRKMLKTNGNICIKMKQDSNHDHR